MNQPRAARSFFSPYPLAGRTASAKESSWADILVCRPQRSRGAPDRNVCPTSLCHEFNLQRPWHEAGAMPFLQKPPHRLPAALAVVQRPVVDVHADELVRQIAVHVPRVLERVSQRLLPVRQRITNALLEQPRNVLNHLGT